MHDEDLKNARILIEQSRILSSIEKTEWLQLLPLMNDQQINELIRILQEQVQRQPAATHSKAAFSSTTASAAFKLPDIAELELPPPPKPLIPKAPPAMPKPFAQQIQPREQAANAEDVAKILEHFKTAPALSPRAAQGAVQQHMRQPVSPVQPQKAASHASGLKPAAPPRPMAGQELVLHSAEDLKKITPAALHGKDPYSVFQKILDFLAEQSKTASVVSMISYLEQSPIQQIYVQTGAILLNSSNADGSEAAFQKIVDSAKASGAQYMTKEEFEAYADFRKELEKL